jgi:enamine deaminase RidA (YjgF/YER057c/UK114 family)
MAVNYLKPAGMHHNPAFSQAILVPAGARTLLIGGQNAVDADGRVVGKGDLGAQTTKALDNLQRCLAAGGATLEQLVQVKLYLKGDVDLRPGFAAWMALWGNRPNPPTVTGLRVHGLAHPDYLIEIEAMAVLD